MHNVNSMGLWRVIPSNWVGGLGSGSIVLWVDLFITTASDSWGQTTLQLQSRSRKALNTSCPGCNCVYLWKQFTQWETFFCVWEQGFDTWLAALQLAGSLLWCFLTHFWYISICWSKYSTILAIIRFHSCWPGQWTPEIVFKCPWFFSCYENWGSQ